MVEFFDWAGAHFFSVGAEWAPGPDKTFLLCMYCLSEFIYAGAQLASYNKRMRSAHCGHVSTMSFEEFARSPQVTEHTQLSSSRPGILSTQSYLGLVVAEIASERRWGNRA